MLYPRMTEEGVLINEDEMVGGREHLSRTKRLLFLTGTITSETESLNLLLAMDSLSAEPIKLIITSFGGDLDAAFLLYDTIKILRSPVITVGRFCASAAVLILAVGTERYLMPHAKVMLHLPSGQMGGDARDWEIQHKQMKDYKDKIVLLIQECGVTKKSEEILADIDRDFWLEPKEAIEYGLADKILDKETLGGWIYEHD